MWMTSGQMVTSNEPIVVQSKDPREERLRVIDDTVDDDVQNEAIDVNEDDLEPDDDTHQLDEQKEEFLQTKRSKMKKGAAQFREDKVLDYIKDIGVLNEASIEEQETKRLQATEESHHAATKAAIEPFCTLSTLNLSHNSIAISRKDVLIPVIAINRSNLRIGPHHGHWQVIVGWIVQLRKSSYIV
ncbi:hypothetical protein BG011_005152 [Mortierella polycephala]|uniref:Uncharacterized protein n=1 Tax=Mortierella polycephala TaxID=41804 RepID=A0A9P6PWA6_9FUNG|nr:hypothetical protein BG011_005152 [Mortierella polycephala]